MKQLRRSMRFVALILVLMILLPIGYGAYSLIRYGTRWRTSEYNTYLTSLKNEVIAGDIYDRNGVRLATTAVSQDLDGDIIRTRLYADDAAVRSNVVHVVGDTRNNVKNALAVKRPDCLFLEIHLDSILAQLTDNSQAIDRIAGKARNRLGYDQIHLSCQRIRHHPVEAGSAGCTCAGNTFVRVYADKFPIFMSRNKRSVVFDLRFIAVQLLVAVCRHTGIGRNLPLAVGFQRFRRKHLLALRYDGNLHILHLQNHSAQRSLQRGVVMFALFE